MMMGIVCFEQKTTICNAKNGDLGDNGDRGSKYVIKSAIFGIGWPWFAYSLCNFYGATMMIKSSLLLSVPLLSIFGRKKLSPVLGQNLTVLGDK